MATPWRLTLLLLLLPGATGGCTAKGRGDSTLVANGDPARQVATRPAAESDLTLIRHGRASFGERLRIAGTSTDPKVLRMLAMSTEPFEVQMLLVMNLNAPIDIIQAYTNLPQDVIDRFEHSEHEILRAAAEWNLANRPDPTTKPTTRPADDND